MSRALAGTLLLACTLTTGCVRFTTKVTYFLVESNGTATLEIGVSEPGVCLNLHGGCADIYQFNFPSHLPVVSAAKILSYKVNYTAPASSERPETGELSITTATNGCSVSVNLFVKSGKPLPINGNFKQSRCGQKLVSVTRLSDVA